MPSRSRNRARRREPTNQLALRSPSSSSMKPELVKTGTTAQAVRAPARAPRWVVPLVKVLLVFSDITLTTLSFVAAFSLRHNEPVLTRTAEGALAWSSQFAPYAVLLP